MQWGWSWIMTVKGFTREGVRQDRSGLGGEHMAKKKRFRRPRLAIPRAANRKARKINRTSVGEMHRGYVESLETLAVSYLETGDRAALLPLFREALEVRRTTLGEKHPLYAASLNNVATFFREMGDHTTALLLFREVLNIRRMALGEDHPDYASSLNNLALLYRDLGDHAAALPLFRQALKIRRTALGEDHPDYATSLNNLAVLHKDMGDHAAALPLYRQALEINRTVLGENHPLYATTMNNLASLYRALGEHAAALPLYRQALEIRRTTLGENHPDYAASLIDVARLYHDRGDHAAALPLYRQALEIRRTALGENHPDFASSLNDLAVMCAHMGEHAAALPLQRQAMEINRTALGENHPDYASSLGNLAGLYRDMGDFAAALPLFRQAMEINRTVLGENHPDYATSLNNLAMLLHENMGDQAAALTLFREALEILRTALGENHPNFATSLNNLAGLYQDMGNHAAALPLFRQALEILGTALGENHPDYATSLNNLAGLYQDMGDHAVALPVFRRALEIVRTTLGENHPDYATSLNNLARLYRAMGDHAAALSLNRQALEIVRTVLGENHPEYATSLNNLAMLLHENMGDHAAALPLYRQALEIRRTALGESHPAYAGSQHNLAALYQDMGNHAAALALYRRATEICRVTLGESHPVYALNLNKLAGLYAATGCASDAMALMEQASTIDDRMIGQILAIGSERQRAAFLITVLADTYAFLSLVLQHLGDAPNAIRSAFELVLRRKAVAAEALATQRDALLEGKYPALEPRLRDLAAMRMQIARSTLAGPGSEGLESHAHGLADWEAQKERLESDLARQIPEMNMEQKLRASDRRAVAMGLPEGLALVEFVRFPVVDFRAVPARGEPRWKPARYVAFVLPGGAQDNVQMVDLGEAESIDRVIADFRAGVIAEAETGDGRDMAKRRGEAIGIAERDAGLALRAAVFDRLAPALGNRTRLLIAPDGDLARLPFEVLPTSDGRRLIDDYQIGYLSCGRDVLRFGAATIGEAGDPLVVADPDFDLETVTLREPAQPKTGFWSRLFGRGTRHTATPRQRAPELATANPFARRRSRDLDCGRGDYHFHRLPGTRAEGEQIANLLGVSPWLDSTALEGRLKTACRSPRILHLATHGFFLPDEERDLNRGGRGFGFEFEVSSGPREGMARFSGPLMESPMLRSGLALAGANTWLKKGELPEEAEDGLLTAEDVTGLDLLATELVVLSACETGLGQVRVGEGVFGLRRAFVLAGAKTLVMSLWKVPDEQTRELMEDFYGRLLDGCGPRRRACAKRSLR